MGLLGFAFRTASRATRTSYRVGRSVARGRVPGVSVGVGVAGFGVRVGTKGIRVRTPIGSQSIGASGFRTTVGVPGIAQLSVRPFKPSASVRLGPLQATAGKHPGVSLVTGLVSVGVTTKPLLWMQAGPVSIALPGQLPHPARRWHEEIDDQWRGAGYQRRPPSFLTSLGQVIRQAETTEFSRALRPIPQPRRPVDAAVELTPAEIAAHDEETRQRALSSIPWSRRSARRAAKATAAQEHTDWLAAIRLRLLAESRARQAEIDWAFSQWQLGEPIAQLIVVNAALGAEETPAVLTTVENGTGTFVVLGPDLDQVHPEGPAVTPSGNPTVKKRTKPQRAAVHDSLLSAATIGAVRVAAFLLRGVETLRVVVAAVDPHIPDLGNQPAVADFRMSVPEAAEETAALRSVDGFLDDRWLARARTLRSLLPGLASGDEGTKALAVAATSANELSSVPFWLEVASAIRALSDPSQLSQSVLPPAELPPPHTRSEPVKTPALPSPQLPPEPLRGRKSHPKWARIGLAIGNFFDIVGAYVKDPDFWLGRDTRPADEFDPWLVMLGVPPEELPSHQQPLEE